MEREANKLRELQAAAEKNEHGEPVDGDEAAVPMETDEEKALADMRSVYVGNVSVALRLSGYEASHLVDNCSSIPQVDYGATPEEIQQHFQACGTINRVTILCDRFTGHPKG